MTKRFFISLLIILQFTQLLLAQKEWSLTKNTENIQVYVRDYPGLSIKELKTIAVFECHAQTLVQLISHI
ncbi:MAG: hypothetical protein Q8R57_02530 [Bacteroidota bacterium]|nr:hypothetical protein [Bacteroidota bacterium]